MVILVVDSHGDRPTAAGSAGAYTPYWPQSTTSPSSPTTSAQRAFGAASRRTAVTNPPDASFVSLR